ncbi:MAG: MFS transporter, partial [Pseudomonadota bacterium]
AGQVFGPPLAEGLLSVMPWQSVFLVFAGLILATLFLLPMLRAPAQATKAQVDESLSKVVMKAVKDPSFTLIFVGFFSCGYQLGFITAHFPAFVTELCGPINPGTMLHNIGITTTSALGAWSISLIGIANIAGTIYAGYLGNRFPKKYLLASIYVGRTLAATIFILLPITPLTVIVFSIVMGSLWLATVPLTSGLVGYIYGLRYMGTLYGLIFFSHQLGSFMGVWLGGWLYDIYGDYTAVWWVGVAVGALSAVVHLPIKERPLSEQHAVPATA